MTRYLSLAEVLTLHGRIIAETGRAEGLRLWSAPVYLSASFAGLFSSRRTVQLLAAATSFTLQIVYMFQQLGVLGGQ